MSKEAYFTCELKLSSRSFVDSKSVRRNLY